jgi:hypothetical protein
MSFIRKAFKKIASLVGAVVTKVVLVSTAPAAWLRFQVTKRQMPYTGAAQITEFVERWSDENKGTCQISSWALWIYLTGFAADGFAGVFGEMRRTGLPVWTREDGSMTTTAPPNGRFQYAWLTVRWQEPPPGEKGSWLPAMLGGKSPAAVDATVAKKKKNDDLQTPEVNMAHHFVVAVDPVTGNEFVIDSYSFKNPDFKSPLRFTRLQQGTLGLNFATNINKVVVEDILPVILPSPAWKPTFPTTAVFCWYHTKEPPVEPDPRRSQKKLIHLYDQERQKFIKDVEFMASFFK